MDLSVDLAPRGKRSLTLANPVMTASGCFGNGLEFARIFDIQRLGGIASKGLTLRPRSGNAQLRVVETAGGMLNSIGLQNIGVEALIRDVAPIWEGWRVPVIVNIAGEAVEDYAELAARLDGVPGISGLELNISCPNVASGLEFGSEPAAAAEVTSAVLRQTTLPVLVKLTPNVTDIVPIARAVVEAGADALTVINTVSAMTIDAERRRPGLGWGSGGLSGPALKPIALRLVYRIAEANLGVPIIGCGGVSSGLDAIEYFMAGASAVQVGTATFLNPRAPLDVLEGIETWLRDHGIENLRDIIGTAQPLRLQAD
ncbi:MAG TPA: dihydroorotate dehydrogenase [Dehalococcoidia bacterium]|nr:dihydroorotate dehydrogenase [Dehalococcoidia bacterium]